MTGDAAPRRLRSWLHGTAGTARPGAPAQHTSPLTAARADVIQPSTWWWVWQKVRAQALTEQQHATLLLRRPYDLRHSGVTWRLNSGVPPTEVAAWAGHSAKNCMTVVPPG